MGWRFRQFKKLLQEKGLRHTLAATKNELRSYMDIDMMHNLAYQPFFERQYGSGIDIMERDWDNLILLDAYRYDYFEEYSCFDGELSKVTSKGSYSWEFIRGNFQGRELHDTVYVTANSFGNKLDQDVFHTVFLFQHEDYSGAVPPEEVTERAIEVNEEFPNKRLIIHYMQPHTPHLGETKRKVSERIGDEFSNMLNEFEEGNISRPTLERSYRESIEVVEPHVKELLEHLHGKTVISSDHGENLGEVQHGVTKVGHRYQTEECRFVPWLELPFDERKSVREDEPVGYEKLEQEEMEKRLAALGYR